MRAMVDLRTSRIKYSNRMASGENFIQLQNAEETILMAFESVVEFDKWAICFQYQQKQYADSQRAQMESAVSRPMGRSNTSDMQSLNGSMMRKQTRTLSLKFSTTIKSEQEVQAARTR